RAAQMMPGSDDPVAHLVYSDGLATVSVFVERRVLQAPAALSPPPAPGVAQVGSSSAFSTVREGSKVTAVGEVPPETVKSIANSVRASSSSSPPPAPAMSLQGAPRR